jgi:hypothetical protein
MAGARELFAIGDLVETRPEVGVVRGRVTGFRGRRVLVDWEYAGRRYGEVALAPSDLVLLQRAPSDPHDQAAADARRKR